MGSTLPDMISWNTSPNNFCNVLHLPSLPMLLIANVFMPSCRSTLSGVGWGGGGRQESRIPIYVSGNVGLHVIIPSLALENVRSLDYGYCAQRQTSYF